VTYAEISGRFRVACDEALLFGAVDGRLSAKRRASGFRDVGEHRFRNELFRVEGKYKLGQNRCEGDIESAHGGLKF
jgi:hypothetical protein